MSSNRSDKEIGDRSIRIAVIAVAIIEAIAMVPLVLHIVNK